MSAKQRVLMSLMLALGGAMLILAALTAAGDDNDITVTAVEEIESIFPERESSILRQDRVGIDLAEGFVGALSFELSDGRVLAIPSDQLDQSLQAIGQFTYKPAEGKVIDSFPPQANCVTATYWPIDDREDVASIRWCFNVL